VPELVQHDQQHDPEDRQDPTHQPILAGRLPRSRRSLRGASGGARRPISLVGRSGS
jgi:hypothetical protein